MAKHARPTLTAEPRERSRRKSEVKNLRLNGQIPGSVFGHGEPENVKLSTKEVHEFLRHHHIGGILDLVLKGKPVPVLLREIDRHPLTGHVITVGLQRVNMQETLRTTVSIEFLGEDELIAEGLVFQRQMDALEVHGRADALPESIVVHLESFKAGDSIRVADLKLPEGVETTRDPELAVAIISLPSVPADVEAALDAEEAEHEAEKEAHATEAAAEGGDEAASEE
jgi:large subunit ribosomal protein L25